MLNLSICLKHKIGHLRIKCCHCHESFPKQITMNKLQQQQMIKQHGIAHFAAKCKNCERKSSIRIDNKSTYMAIPNENGIVKSLIAIFECRGIDIEKIQIGNSFSVKIKNSQAVFQHADFTDLWCQYDEAIGCVAQVEDVKFEIKIAK